MNSAPPLTCAVALALFAPVVMAQEPAGPRGDRDVTMGVIADPDARDAAEIERKIPSPKPRSRTQRSDGSATDLANPRGGDVQGGTPETCVTAVAVAPVTLPISMIST